MVHVHGAQAQQLAQATRGVDPAELVAVPVVRVGVEAAGHYHQPLVSTGVLPADWQLVQVNPTQVASQRQLAGRRRLKTDALDLVAISDLLRAGRRPSRPGLGAGRAGWVGGPPGAAGHGPDCLEEPALGPGRPGLPRGSGGVSSLFGTKVGRLVLAEFTDPARLSALG